MIIASRAQVILAALQKHSGQLEGLGLDHSLPIFNQIVGGDPVFVGSVFMFRVADHLFLLTAHHVMAAAFAGKSPNAHPQEAHFLVPNGHNGTTNELVPISGSFSGFAATNVDVAALQLDRESIARVRWRGVSLNETRAMAGSQGWFMVDGCPQALVKRDGHRFEPTHYQFVAAADPTAVDHDDRFRIALALNRNDHIRLDGSSLAAPHLEGISGSPIWQIFSDDTASRYEPRLVGIQTGYFDIRTAEGPGWSVRGTRWPFVREILARIIPETMEAAARLVLP